MRNVLLNLIEVTVRNVLETYTEIQEGNVLSMDK